MSRSDDKVVAFATWALTRSYLRYVMSFLDVVAGRISDQLLIIDPQLGVEVGDDEPGLREVIVTAFSEPSLFPLVHRIVGSVSDISGWCFVALKPPRGFAFKLSAGGSMIDAKALAFAPIPDVDAGIQLVVSPAILTALPGGREAEELGWLIVETESAKSLPGEYNMSSSAARGLLARACRSRSWSPTLGPTGRGAIRERSATLARTPTGCQRAVRAIWSASIARAHPRSCATATDRGGRHRARARAGLEARARSRRPSLRAGSAWDAARLEAAIPPAATPARQPPWPRA